MTILKMFDSFKLKNAKKDIIQYGTPFVIGRIILLKTLKKMGNRFFYIGYMVKGYK